MSGPLLSDLLSTTAAPPQSQPGPPIALTVKSVAATYGLSIRAVYRLLKSGQLEARQAGPYTTLIDAESVRAWYAGLPRGTRSTCHAPGSAGKAAASA
jgi:hypothetical protein